MTKKALAADMRNRQRTLNLVDRAVIDALTDDVIIMSYVTCSCCGRKQVNDSDLPEIIRRAVNTDAFMLLCQTEYSRNDHGPNPPKKGAMH